MTHILGHDRSQTFLFTQSIDDYICADNPVRFIDAFVDGLDLQPAGFARVEAKATGRSGYAPSDLPKLDTYGYLNRVRSSRRLESDFQTIANLRRINFSVFRQFVLRCRDLDLFGRQRPGEGCAGELAALIRVENP